jgi:predicted small lipoprotein YifL
MKTLLIILYVVYAALYVAGCAYKGDVYIYSPGGDVERATELDSNVSLK